MQETASAEGKAPVPTTSPRVLGKSNGARLYVDQWAWIERMNRERAADMSQLVRNAVDAYRPVFEAIGDRSDEATKRRVLERFERLMDATPIAQLEAFVDRLENDRIADAIDSEDRNQPEDKVA